jgi:hypothetical protein
MSVPYWVRATEEGNVAHAATEGEAARSVLRSRGPGVHVLIALQPRDAECTPCEGTWYMTFCGHNMLRHALRGYAHGSLQQIGAGDGTHTALQPLQGVAVPSEQFQAKYNGM